MHSLGVFVCVCVWCVVCGEWWCVFVCRCLPVSRGKLKSCRTAQSRLQAAVKHFPMATVPLVKDFIRILPQSGIPDEKITGAAYSLMIKTLMVRACKNLPPRFALCAFMSF